MGVGPANCEESKFLRAPRLSSLLIDITERKLSGHADEISEQLIAKRVFGRPAGYNAAEDSIVRSHARLFAKSWRPIFRAKAQRKS